MIGQGAGMVAPSSTRPIVIPMNLRSKPIMTKKEKINNIWCIDNELTAEEKGSLSSKVQKGRQVRVILIT